MLSGDLYASVNDRDNRCKYSLNILFFMDQSTLKIRQLLNLYHYSSSKLVNRGRIFKIVDSPIFFS